MTGKLTRVEGQRESTNHGKRDVLDIANEAIRPLEVDHVRNQRANRPNEEEVCEPYPRSRQPGLDLREIYTPPYIWPDENILIGPMTPQTILAVPNTSVLGQMNPFFCVGLHISGMFVNIQACTPSWTVPAIIVATTWA